MTVPSSLEIQETNRRRRVCTFYLRHTWVSSRYIVLVYEDNTSKQMLNRHTLEFTHTFLSTRNRRPLTNTIKPHLHNSTCIENAVNPSCKERRVQLSKLHLVSTCEDFVFQWKDLLKCLVSPALMRSFDLFQTLSTSSRVCWRATSTEGVEDKQETFSPSV